MRRGNDDENVAGAERATVVYRLISELRPDPRNPRAHRPSQIRQIARSIEEFGFNVPVLVDANLKVIAGHGRLLACKNSAGPGCPQFGWITSAMRRSEPSA